MQDNFVSIIIPCRNEEKYIGKCLDSIIANDYPKEKLEILAIDGMSKDKTREIIKKYTEKFPFIKFLDNQKRIIPTGLNIGIKNAKGEIIIRMDVHATYAKNYISKCLKYLEKYNADNVGGIIKTLPEKNSIIAKAIALALSNLFGTGTSYFRIGSKEPRWVDTVFGGCYKKEVFEKIGFFDENLVRSEDLEFNLRLKKVAIGFFNENLVRSQDLEFNLRLKKAGGRILLVPEIISYYYAKSNLKDFFIHNFKDGIWAIYPLKFVKTPFRLRHYLPLLFVVSLIGSALLSILFPIFWQILFFIFLFYFLVNLYFSLGVAVKEKSLKYFFIMPIVFATRHFGYGFGSIFGLIKLLK